MRRRDFLSCCGAGVVCLGGARADGATKTGSKPLRGIFPIAQSPFTEANKLDVDALVAELRFIDRGRVHGLVWPQLASEWWTLSEPERLAGAEALLEEGKRLRPAVVIGVQAPSVQTAVKYARHAERLGADAIISLPPDKETDSKVILEYYKDVGRATALPLFLQAVGKMDVDLVVEIGKAVPTLRYVKDEAGQPLLRFAELREKSGGQLNIFTGGAGRTLLDEMRRGFSGSMPAAPLADIYASAWDLWHAGRHAEAMAAFGKAAILLEEEGAYGVEADKYMLCLRGVFTTYRTRGGKSRLDESGKETLKELVKLATTA